MADDARAVAPGALSDPHGPSEEPADPPGPRLDSLTGLRWWAAFAVFVHHVGNLAPLPIQEHLSFGTYGVTFFFVLSGFVLTWAARTDPGPRPRVFYWRRFARIYPAHLVALLLAIPVFYAVAPDPAQWWVKPLDVGVLLLSVVLLQGWWREPGVLFSGNPAAWTLSCEAFFYAMHPLVHRWLRRVTHRGALLVAVGVAAAILLLRVFVVVVPSGPVASVPWPVLRLGEFVLGMALARAVRLGWRPRWHPVWPALALAAVAVWTATAESVEGELGLLGFVVGPEAVAPLFAPELVVLSCAGLVTACALRELDGGARALRGRVLVRLGEWSYAFYLLHATVIYALVSLWGRQGAAWGNLGWFGLAGLVSLAAAAALHHGVEKPLERRLRPLVA